MYSTNNNIPVRAQQRYLKRYYILFISGSLLLLVLTNLGYLNYESLTDSSKIWIPQDSAYNRNSEWIKKHVSSAGKIEKRANSIIVESTSGNILKAESLKEIYDLHLRILDLKTSKNTTFQSICFKSRVSLSRKPGAGIGSYPDQVCAAFSNVSSVCDSSVIFDIWAKNGEHGPETKKSIEGLTQTSIFEALKGPLSFSQVFKRPFNPLLGSKRLSKDGKLEGASAVLLMYFTKTDQSDGEKGKNEVLNWERLFIKTVNDNKFSSKDLFAYPNAGLSFPEEFRGKIEDDLQLFIFGYLIVFIYVLFALGKFNSLEHKAYLAIVGIAAVGMGYASANGLCLIFGAPTTPMNSILPFMLLGIGIDDMFVIVHNYENIRSSVDPGVKTSHLIGETMKSAGVAITVTSVTDILAFGIGGLSDLPALKYFCIYASAGIFFVYLYMITIFLGIFVLDVKRVNDRRDACLFCIKKSPSWTPWVTTEPYQKIIFKKYSKVFAYLPTKVAIITITSILLGVGIYGVTLIGVKFDPKWFLSPDSYLLPYLKASDKHYSSEGGIQGQMYLTYPQNSLKEINSVYKALKEEENGTLEYGSVRSFHPSFVKETNTNSSFKYSSLTKFLYTSTVPYDWAVKFGKNGKPKCGDVSEDVEIKAFVISYRHKKEENVRDRIQGMKKMYSLVEPIKKASDSQQIFPHSKGYSNSITLDVIVNELFRNILLAMVCVFGATLFLLAEFFTSVYVLVSVLLTIVDVTGFMYFWDLSIDTSSAVLLTVSMGLAVDYSAHIAHGYIHAKGSTRNEKVVQSLTNVGPAVLNGGFSTFLAFSLLANSKSYVFKTFFKIFFLVVLFGLYHGLAFLPVVLSLIGPKFNKVETEIVKKN